MIHFTLALGILVTAIVLKPLYLALLFALEINANIGLFHRMQLLGELLLILGLLFAWAVVRLAHLNRRLPTPVPGGFAITAGVWAFFAVLLVTLISRLVPHAVYLIAAFPIKYVLDSLFTSVVINTVLLFGIGVALLAADPTNASNGVASAKAAP